MATELLVTVTDAQRAMSEVVARGGRVPHVLSSRLLVVALPDDVPIGSLEGVTPVQSGDVEGLAEDDKPLAEAWITRFSTESSPVERLARAAAQPPTAWDTPGRTPPDGPDDDDANFRAPSAGVRSTGTPTSLTLTGSVAVGIVMVSGPAEAWRRIGGALKHVSVAADGTVWGVNASDEIYRRDGNSWTRISGALKQISTGNANSIWGVNASNEIYRRDGNSWTRISGALKHVSVANDGTVWGVNASDEIYRRDGNSWTRISGALKQISTGNANSIWGVNASNEIYRRDGNSWTRISGALKHVSVANDGTVWGVNASDEIYRRDGNSWTRIPGALKQISTGNANSIWGVNASNQIYFRSPETRLDLTASERQTITAEVLEGLAFLASADPDANVSFVYDWRHVTVGVGTGFGDSYEEFEAPWRNAALRSMGFTGSRQGSRDYVNHLRSSRSTNWAYVAYFTRYPLHHFAYAGQERCVMHYENDGWTPASINQVFAHETCHIFGAADEYGSCGCGGSGMSNTPNLNCVNCTNAQIACLMNANTLSLCRYSRGQIGWSLWRRISGALKHVSVAADGTVWGVNASDEIYRRDGNSWTRISGALKQISTGNANSIWGVNASNEIYRRDGNSWTRISGALKHVSVANDGTVWGVNASDEIYRRDGNSWTRIPGALKQISTGNANSIWGVNASNEIYRRDGNSWTRISGALKHVSVANDGTVWGVNASDEIYRRDGNSWTRIPGALKQISTGNANSIWGVNASNQIYVLR